MKFGFVCHWLRKTTTYLIAKTRAPMTLGPVVCTAGRTQALIAASVIYHLSLSRLFRFFAFVACMSCLVLHLDSCGLASLIVHRKFIQSSHRHVAARLPGWWCCVCTMWGFFMRLPRVAQLSTSATTALVSASTLFYDAHSRQQNKKHFRSAPDSILYPPASSLHILRYSSA